MPWIEEQAAKQQTSWLELQGLDGKRDKDAKFPCRPFFTSMPKYGISVIIAWNRIRKKKSYASENCEQLRQNRTCEKPRASLIVPHE